MLTQTITTIAKYALSLKAANLIEDLEKAGIGARYIQPKWTNKKLPPPKVEVQVKESDVAAAMIVLKEFEAKRR